LGDQGQYEPLILFDEFQRFDNFANESKRSDYTPKLPDEFSRPSLHSYNFQNLAIDLPEDRLLLFDEFAIIIPKIEPFRRKLLSAKSNVKEYSNVEP